MDCQEHSKRFWKNARNRRGLGEYIGPEHLTAAQEANYTALELRENMAVEISRRFSRIRTVVGDCQGPRSLRAKRLTLS
jgi:hypothetical protein